jgi:hypothetical protein
MKTRNTLAMVAIGLAASVAASQAAVDINGTLGIVPFGNVAFTGPNLGAATSLTAPIWEVVNNTPALYNAVNNDFFVGAGMVSILTPVTLNPLTLNLPFGAALPAYMTFSFASALDSYIFDLNTLTVSSSDPNHLSLAGTGVLRTQNGSFNPTPTLFSASFNTTGVGAANGSFTLSTAVVPEPATYIAGLGALCLFGFTAIPKRKH